ncbi:MAG: DUF2283 domain-containing protein [Ignavibacteriales bacterium]|nr:DUF2283 domain-containing protein [Ignavibacteriales bacterium]
MQKIKYSKDVDALLIELSDKPIDHAEEEGQIIIHFTKENEPVMLEILDASQFIIRAFQSVINQKEITDAA